jgi:hypothetical protein
MKIRHQIHLLIIGILLSSLIASLSNAPVFKIIIIAIILYFLTMAVAEFIFYFKERNYIIAEKRPLDYPQDISILNNGYEVIENCFVKISKLNVIGSDGKCEKIVDGNWDEIFRWLDKSERVSIPNNAFETLNIFNATNEKLELVFQEHSIPLTLYECTENVKNAKYQLEVIVCGTAKNNGGTDSIKRKNWFEISYQSSKKSQFPTFTMEKINKMKKPNGKIADKKLPLYHSFNISVSDNINET